MKTFTFKFRANCFVEEVGWVLQQGDEILEEMDFVTYTDNDQEYVEDVCFDPSNGCLSFEIIDEFGDGLACEFFVGGEDGYYKLLIDDNVVHSGEGDFGDSELTDLPCGINPGGPGGPGDYDYEYDYDYDYNYINPFIGLCDEGEVATVVFMNLGSHPEEQSWELINADNGDIVASANYSEVNWDSDYSSDENGVYWNEDYYFNISFAYHEICTEPFCMELTVIDSFGDGSAIVNASGDSAGHGWFAVISEGEWIVDESGDFGSDVTVEFCVETAAPTIAPTSK